MTRKPDHHIVDTGLTSAFYCSRAFARVADPDVGGSIVMNGSIESVRGRPRLSHYPAAKFAMVGLTQTLALDLGVFHVWTAAAQSSQHQHREKRSANRHVKTRPFR